MISVRIATSRHERLADLQIVSLGQTTPGYSRYGAFYSRAHSAPHAYAKSENIVFCHPTEDRIDSVRHFKTSELEACEIVAPNRRLIGFWGVIASALQELSKESLGPEFTIIDLSLVAVKATQYPEIVAFMRIMAIEGTATCHQIEMREDGRWSQLVRDNKQIVGTSKTIHDGLRTASLPQYLSSMIESVLQTNRGGKSNFHS